MSPRRGVGRALVALAIMTGAPTAGALQACNSTSAAEVQNARQAVANGAILLDVRTRNEFAGGHIEGAVNIPVQELAQRQGELPAGRDVVVYCRSGNRSGQAATMLRKSGRKVIDIGPMSAW